MCTEIGKKWLVFLYACVKARGKVEKVKIIHVREVLGKLNHAGHDLQIHADFGVIHFQFLCYIWLVAA